MPKSPYQQELADLSHKVPSVTVTMTYYEASFVRDALNRAANQLDIKLDSVRSDLLRTIMTEQQRVLSHAAVKVQLDLDEALDTLRQPRDTYDCYTNAAECDCPACGDS